MKILFDKVFFTDQKRCQDLKEIIKKMPKNSAVIFREYNLEKQEREKLACKIFAICQEKNHKFLIGKDFLLAKKIGADGVHFSDFDKLPQEILHNKPEKFIFSYACHNFFSVLISKKLNPDLIFITPIFKTKSHEGSQALGLFKAWFFKLFTSKPVFALGGINENNFKTLKKLGFQGFGGIEIFIK